MKADLDKGKNKIEVSFSTAIYPFHDNKDCITVVVDIFRATTAICTAFMNGVKELIPVATVDEAREYKDKGYLVASERDGIKIDFADFGNSPFNFTKERVEDKTIVYSTTNGTKAIMIANQSDDVLVGSFLNLNAIKEFLVKENKDVIISCAGWKKRFSLEDSLFAGALAHELLNTGKFDTICDSAAISVDMWKEAKPDLLQYIEKAAHRHRLKKMQLDDVIEYCMTLDQTDIIPLLKGNCLVSNKS